MKKIDLHIHTVPTFSDSDFTFSLDTFKKYVNEACLHAVAITNHDMFDRAQFETIQHALDIHVFPGIEINVDKGHILVISHPHDLDNFESKANKVAQRIVKPGDSLSVEELIAIYGTLNNYLVIPHYDKGPPIAGETLEKLKPFVCAGEVDSAKKFLRLMKDDTKLTPVLFSDARMKADLNTFPTRQTFVDCGNLTIGALKTCLQDKAKVALSESDGNKLFQVFADGQMLSTGLNVVIGARSTGKTHTLNEISKTSESVKYIKQFSLVQQDDVEYEREFNRNVESRRSVFADNYLSGLKRVLDDIMTIDLDTNSRDVDRYVETLLTSANDADRQDAFSRATLFDEIVFSVGNTKTLVDLISSVQQVIENIEFRTVIEKHVSLTSLRALACELIELLWATTLENEKKKYVNGLIREIKQALKVLTSAVQVHDVDFYEVSMDEARVQRFAEIVGYLKTQAVIFSESIQAFRVEAIREPFVRVADLKMAIGVKASLATAFNKYDDPYRYLRELLASDSVPRSDLYKSFVKITFRILNKDGFQVSGGERSEFRLLQEIADAQNYDILLIDEPESSFDNVFLKTDVNQILKAISESMPVVVVTHNNTVGASIGADFMLLTTKELEDGKPVYRIYSGYPTDKELRTVEGNCTSTHITMMDSLEAGFDAYTKRAQGYEAVRN